MLLKEKPAKGKAKKKKKVYFFSSQDTLAKHGEETLRSMMEKYLFKKFKLAHQTRGGTAWGRSCNRKSWRTDGKTLIQGWECNVTIARGKQCVLERKHEGNFSKRGNRRTKEPGRIGTHAVRGPMFGDY